MSGISFSDGQTSASVGSLDIERSVNGEVHYSVVNKSEGTSALTALILAEDVESADGYSSLSRYNSNYTGTLYAQPNSTLLRSGGDGGLVLQASNAAGQIKFVTGGLNNVSALKMTLDEDGNLILTNDDAYGAGWNGSLEVPTKNAIYDKIETISGGAETFETVSKNLKSYPATLNYTGSSLTSIEYDIGTGTITKTLNYTGSSLTSIVLSGDTPGGIDLTKTLSYTSGNLTGIAYS